MAMSAVPTDTNNETMIDVESPTPPPVMTKEQRHLSIVSKMYDIDGDGELDDAEKAMREMDKSGRGHLKNEEVYALMQTHVKMQQDLFRFKKVVMGLLAFVVVLALSNLGTSFAAAYLAKDTTTNGDSQLVDSKTKETVSTQVASDSFPIERYEDTTARKLCTNQGGEITCETTSYLKMPENKAELMILKCKKGNIVNLNRVWHDGSETLTNICGPGIGGTFSLNRISTLANGGITMTPLADGSYRLDGSMLIRNETDVCDKTVDCNTGLECVKDEVQIGTCQERCRRLRFGPSRLQPCLDDCVFLSCQKSD